MDFKFSPDQEDLKMRAAEFARQYIEPVAAEMETECFPPELFAALGKMGFMNVRLPAQEEPGLGHLDRVILLEAISRYSAALGLVMVGQLLGIATIMEFGGEDLKRTYLPSLIRGEMLVAVAITESVGGSDPTVTTTQAVREGEFYRVSGRKVFITNSHLAGLILVVARTSPDPRRGLSVIALNAGAKGFRPGHREEKIGLKGCVTGEIIMENVLVPEVNLLGCEGDGLAIALKGISEYGRNGNAGVALGLMQGIYEETLTFCRDNNIMDQANMEILAMIYADTVASRMLTYKASWHLDQGRRVDAEIASAKFFANDASLRCARRAFSICNGSGLTQGTPLERYFRDSVPLISADGTGDIQRLVAARSLVGEFPV